jgi:glycolate oxidase FAD binding subunit
MPVHESVRGEFRRILGAENLREGDSDLNHAPKGRIPSLILYPASLDEAAACSSLCFEEGLTVLPLGGGTRLGFGPAARKAEVGMSTARMDRLADYQPADMTVTVEGGMTLARLQALLGERNQWLPLDPPSPNRATLGGIVAARDTGILRHAFGSPRDFLIGLKVADPEGEIVKGGSKVVKNVAGYDLPKLYVGSWGTLGLLSELTFRVLPLPEKRTVVHLSLRDSGAAEPILAEIIDSELLPSFVELLNEPARAALLPGLDPGWRIVLGIDGDHENVEWQIERLSRLCESRAEVKFSVLPEPLAASFRAAAADFPLSTDSALTIRVSLLSSQVAEFAEAAESAAVANDCKISILTHAGVGLMTIHLAGASGAEGVIPLLETLRESARALKGRITVERASPNLGGSYDPWPDFGDGAPLMANLKRSLDPKGLWNPGFFVAF